jgi:hypothetical protein
MDMSFNLYVLQGNSYKLLTVDIYKDDKDKKRYVEFDTTKIFLKSLKVTHLKDYVCKKEKVDVPDLKFWKLNNDIKYKDIKEQNISTQEDIVRKLNGGEMELDLLFSEYFQAELNKLDDDNDYVPVSSIITIIPATNGKCLPMVYLSNKKFAVTKYRVCLISFFRVKAGPSQQSIPQGTVSLVKLPVLS